MDAVFFGRNIQDSPAMSEPMAMLVHLGAVAAAVSLSATGGLKKCLFESGDAKPSKPDEVLGAWLDSLRTLRLG